MIYARSPYIVHVDDSGLQNIEFKLYVYRGTKDTDKGTATYEFAIDAVNGEVTFDISPYIRSAFGNPNPAFTNKWVWVTTEIDKNTGGGLSGSFSTYEATQLACMGWNTPEDGVNYTTLLRYGAIDLFSHYTQDSASANWAVKPVGETGIICVQKYPLYLGLHNWTIEFYPQYGGNGTMISSVTRNATNKNEHNDWYQYTTVPANALSANLTEASGTFGDSIVNFWEVGDCRGSQTRIDYINAQGVRDTLWFMGRESESYTVSQSKYRKNILSAGAYDLWNPQQAVFNKNGKRRKRINSGHYPEMFNEMFKEMLLADRVWIYENSTRKSVSIVNSDLSYKYHNNERVINYEIEIEYAHDALNSIM